MKTGKILSAGRNDFTEPCFAKTSTGIPEKCASARFWEVSHCSVKSDMPTCEQDIMPSNLNGFTIRSEEHTSELQSRE